MRSDAAAGSAVAPSAASLLAIAVDAATKTGAFLLSARPADLVVATKSTPTDVVTQMDTDAERMIAAAINAVRPDDAMVGEEGQGQDRAGSLVRWIVDPIDGTVNYLYRLPQWAVSIAAEVDGVVVAGAVFDPSKGELFTACLGEGAALNGVRIGVSDCTDLGQALVGTGFGYDAARRARQAQVLTGVLPRVRDIRRLGAASLDLCSLACARLDGYFERGLNLWDHAAAGLIAAEAGARVEGLHGSAPSDALLVAASSALFPALHDLVAELGADRD